MQSFTCPEVNCQKKFSRQSNLNRHFQIFHINKGQLVEKCVLCGNVFDNCQDLQKHLIHDHKPSKQFVMKESAFKKAFITYRLTFKKNEHNFANAQFKIKPAILDQIIFEAAKKTICRVNLIFIAEMVMLDHQGEKMTTASIPFRSSSFLANAQDRRSIAKNISKSFLQQAESMEDFMRSGSNWEFERGIAFDIEFAALKPILVGNSQEDAKINIHDFKNKRFVYNPCNKDQKCFLYCISYFLFQHKIESCEKKNEDKKLKKQFTKFNLTGIKFPISINGVKKFLKLNKHLDLKINILFRTKDAVVHPFEYGLGSGKKIVNLLMLQKKIGDLGVNHFLLIKDANKFLRRIYKYGPEVKTSTSYQKVKFCLHCLNSFSDENNLQKHIKICSLNKPRIEIVPEEGENLIKFKNYDKQHMLEYIAFLDFECELPKENTRCDVCMSLKCKCDASFTDILTKQNPIGYSFVVLNQNNKIIHEHSNICENAADNFLEHLLSEENRWIRKLLDASQPMKMSRNDVLSFEDKTECYLCGIGFSAKAVKCRDHSHITGAYLGAACQNCNLRRRKPNKLKIFIHNGSR